jgi:DNA polymerase III subunit epsilon
MLREIVLDTETTGLDHRRGDRIIEIGCVEIINRIPTGRTFHEYIHPEDREVHPDAQAVHGITMEMLQGKPAFKAIATAFMDFVGDAPLVIHNAAFDIAFINSELQRLSHPAILMDRVVDTLSLARRKHPGGQNSLDALCKRYAIDNSKRAFHGALLDSWLLAEVYLELLGERQATLGLAQSRGLCRADAVAMASAIRVRPRPLAPRLSAADLEAHRNFVESLGKDALWLGFDARSAPADYSSGGT